MYENQLEKMNNNLEEIWHRLEGIEHFVREIAEHGILDNEIHNCIVAIARAQNKELDKKYKELEKVIVGEV